MGLVSTSSDSRISTYDMELVVQKLLCTQTRTSTSQTYLSIWCQFNNFNLSLDVMPSWEQRTTLYIAHLIERGFQSGTIKSYVSAIKKLLITEGYKWRDEDVLTSSLTRACKLINDRVNIRLPIHCSLLEILLFEIERIFPDSQIYLQYLYKSLLLLGYYGMMRVGEITEREHMLRAQNVHLARNKDKLLLILYSSKTHDRSSRPQKIKITSNRSEKSGKYVHRNFCPFGVLRTFLSLRGGYRSEYEQFFIFRDGGNVKPVQANSLLKRAIANIGLKDQVDFYSIHSLRIG